MAFNPSLKVADCREIARKWKRQQVIIIAIDRTANQMEYASYGETKALCDDAKQLADVAFEAIMSGGVPVTMETEASKLLATDEVMQKLDATHADKIQRLRDSQILP